MIILNDDYAIDENFVYVVNSTHTAWVKMPNADRVSFKILDGQYARDADQIFQMGKKIEGADQNSFSVISGEYGYAKDAQHVYGPGGVIAGADPQTFQVLTQEYSMDSGHVYYNGKNMPEANSGSFTVVDR